MATSHLTDRRLQTLHTERIQEDVWDDSLPGFGVRLTHKGRKSFVLMFRLHGIKRRITLGSYPTISLADARHRAKTLLGEVAAGRDPQAQQRAQPSSVSFHDLAGLYFDRYGRHHNRRKTWQEDERLLRRDVFPVWRGRLARDLTRRDVAELLDEILRRGAPATANKVRAAISKVYNWGIGRDLVENNPCFRLPRPAKPRSRDRVLNAEEIRALWAVLPQVPVLKAASFRLRLLTAQRSVEVLSWRWDQIDGDWWTIPGEVSKNHKAHRVFLAPQTWRVLELLRELGEGSPWVFPSIRGRSGHLEDTKATAREVATLSGVVFRPHDLRRTAATMMAQMGIPRLVVGKVLNHTDGDSSVTAVYDRHSYDAEKQEAWCRWAARLEEIVGELLGPRGVEAEVMPQGGSRVSHPLAGVLVAASGAGVDAGAGLG